MLAVVLAGLLSVPVFKYVFLTHRWHLWAFTFPLGLHVDNASHITVSDSLLLNIPSFLFFISRRDNFLILLRRLLIVLPLFEGILTKEQIFDKGGSGRECLDMGPRDLNVDYVDKLLAEESADDEFELDGAGHGEDVDLELLHDVKLQCGPPEEDLPGASHVVPVDYHAHVGTNSLHVVASAHLGRGQGRSVELLRRGLLVDDVEVEFFVVGAALVHVHFEIRGGKAIGLSELLDLLPLPVDILGEELQLALLLVELPARVLDVVLEELEVVVEAVVRPLVFLVLHELNALQVERNQGEGRPTLPLLVELLQLDGEVVLQAVEVRVRVQVHLAHDQVQPVVPLLIGVHAVAQDRILFLRLVRLRGLKGQIGWPSYFICQKVIVELQFAVPLEEGRLVGGHQRILQVVYEGFLPQNSLLQSQNVKVCAFLMDLRVSITVDTVNAEFSKHFIVFECFSLVQVEDRDLFGQQLINIRRCCQWFLNVLFLVIPVIGGEIVRALQRHGIAS